MFWSMSWVMSAGRGGIKSTFSTRRIEHLYRRPTEVDYLLADVRKAKQVLGWAPRIGFHDLVHGGTRGRDPAPLRYGEAAHSARTVSTPPSSSVKTCMVG